MLNVDFKIKGYSCVGSKLIQIGHHVQRAKSNYKLETYGITNGKYSIYNFEFKYAIIKYE